MKTLLLVTIGCLCAQRPEWTAPYPSHKIAGNVYYVGTEDLACFLITDPKGHILINTGLADSVDGIRKGIESFGFQYSDVKILLTMQGHFDHVAGFARIVRETKAKVYATAADAPILESGGKLDPVLGASAHFAPVNVSRRLLDGDTIRLGKTALKVHLTPGHTMGSVSYSMTVPEGSLWFVNMGTVVMPLVGNEKYPNIVKDLRDSFARQKTWNPDIWVAAHGSQYGMAAKHRAGKGFADREGYAKAIAETEQRFQRQLKIEGGQ